MKREAKLGIQAQGGRLELHILHKLPTPYNDALFQRLAARNDIDLQVHHLWRGSWRRPWQTELGLGYPNRYMKLRAGVDWTLLGLSLRHRKAFFMIGDWGHLAALAILITRVATGAPVAIWTDTPQEDLPRHIAKRWARRVLLRWLLAKVDRVFASGTPGVQVVKAMGGRGDSVVNLPCFVDLDRPRLVQTSQRAQAAVRRLRGDQMRSCVFAMIGTLVERKGQDLGVRAFAECVSRSGGELRLLIAGEGPERSRLQQLVDDLGITGSTEFLGWLEPEQIEELYMATDVIVHPARWDPFPLVVLEAMSWGKVVIASDVCGSAVDRIQNGRNGYMFSEGNVDELTELILQVSKIEATRRDIGAVARRTAEEWPLSRGVETIISSAEQVVGRRFG